MELLAKTIVLLMVGILLVSLPVFIWLFIKTFYHYQKMIRGIKRSTYSKGHFILGPFLLSDNKYFDKDGQKIRLLFFGYFKKTGITFCIMIVAFIVMNVVKYSSL